MTTAAEKGERYGIEQHDGTAGGGLMACIRCGGPAFGDTLDHCLDCAHLALRELRRERDEARAELQNVVQALRRHIGCATIEERAELDEIINRALPDRSNQ